MINAQNFINTPSSPTGESCSDRLLVSCFNYMRVCTEEWSVTMNISLCVWPSAPDSNPPCSAVHQSVRPEDKWLPVMGVVASWPVERISWCLLLWGHLSVTDRHRCIFIDALTSYFCLHAFIQSLCIFKDSQLHFRSVSSLRNSSQWVTTKTFM